MRYFALYMGHTTIIRVFSASSPPPTDLVESVRARGYTIEEIKIKETNTYTDTWEDSIDDVIDEWESPQSCDDLDKDK
jgi:tRNA G26 N,N-dimethylase Trm1